MNKASVTKKWVALYREMGLCPLPSRSDTKAPQLPTYRNVYAGEPVPKQVYAQWNAQNVQLVTGVLSPTPTKILVVDCDGERAIATWQQMCAWNQWLPSPSWTVRTGGDGLHFYFRVPSSTPSVPTGLIWGLWDSWGRTSKGSWVKHEEIKILGDRTLVVAPPSLHPTTLQDYSYVGPDRPGPVSLPEEAPTWLLKSIRLPSQVTLTPPSRPTLKLPPPSAAQSDPYERNSVLQSIEDKASLARSWGLDFVTTKTTSGWLPAFVPGRELRGHSRSPSGSFHLETGILRDHSNGGTMSLFDVGVALGVFNTWIEALNWCGARFGG